MSTAKSYDTDELYNNCSSEPKEVTCFCGKTAFTIFNGRVRQVRECACNDCFQHLTWAYGLGGPKFPPISTISYWDNDFRMDRGEENLIVVMLRVSGRSTRLVAKCCYSSLVVDHTSYNGL